MSDVPEQGSTASPSRPDDKRNLWANTFDQAPTATAVLNPRGRYLYVNGAFRRLLGSTATTPLRPIRDKSRPASHAAVPRALLETALAQGHAAAEVRHETSDGRDLWIQLSCSVISHTAEQPRYVLVQAEDSATRHCCDQLRRECVTNSPIGMALLSHLHHLAMHDPLTGLGNRTLLADNLGRHLATLDRIDGVLVVLVADLDGLKQINDRYGHRTGDQLLTAAAQRLSSSVPSGVAVTRLGGDEFVVTGVVDDIAAAKALRDHIAQRLDAEIIVAGRTVELKASVGLAITQDPATPHDELLHRADQDMYSRKPKSRTAPAARP